MIRMFSNTCYLYILKVLTKPEIEVASKVVKAEIVNHPTSDPNIPQGDASSSSGKKCVIM